MPDSTSLPLLSVVIPTHNTRELADEAVQSVLAQAPENTEIILVDDHSCDGTAEWMTNDRPMVTVIRNKENLGFSASANRGLSAARGRILLLLNSDAALGPGSLKALLDAFKDDPTLGVAGAELRYPDGSPQWSGGSFPTLPWLFALTSGGAVLAATLPFYRRFKKPGTDVTGPVQWVTGAAMAVRREVWTDVGPLDEGYRFYGQDLDLCRQAGDARWRVALIPGFVAVHHHGATITAAEGAAGAGRPELLWADLLRFVERNDGPGKARRALTVMRAGARLRLVAMTIALPFGSQETRKARRIRRATFACAKESLQRPPI